MAFVETTERIRGMYFCMNRRARKARSCGAWDGRHNLWAGRELRWGRGDLASPVEVTRSLKIAQAA